MTKEQRAEILDALRHGRLKDSDEDLESIIMEDLDSLEPLIDRFIKEAMEEME